MELSFKQKRRAQSLFTFLHNQPLEYFVLNGIRKCEKCDGTGLGGIYKYENSYSWDNHTYCDECHGVGYRGLAGALQIDDIHYLCKHCEGVGCDKCKDGVVDWVTHAMG